MTAPLSAANPRPQPYGPPQSGGSGPEDGGGAFADILTAGAGGRLPGPAPFPEHGPAIVAVPPEWQASSLLVGEAVSLSGPDARDTLPEAQQFNQYGFFGRTENMVPPASIPPVDYEALGSLEPSQPALAQTSGGSTLFRPGIGLAYHVSGGVSAARLTAIPPIEGPQATERVTAAQPMGAEPLPPERSVEASRSPGRRAQARAALSGQATVQIILRELEHGLHVAARVDALGEGERELLHDEIVALLARHGLGTRNVVISAPSRPTNHERIK